MNRAWVTPLVPKQFAGWLYHDGSGKMIMLLRFPFRTVGMMVS